MTALIRGRASKSAPPPAISVNGTVIARSAITSEIQYHPAASAAESWRKAAEALAIREILLQEAARQGVAAIPRIDRRSRRETAEEATIRALVEREVRVPEPTEDELRRYYEANQPRFRAPEIVEARHILIAARADDAIAYAAAREKAETLAAELAANPGQFASLAEVHSDCVSAGAGGHLGQLALDETTPEFAAALVRLADGETTRNPVETRYGFHLIRLERRIEGRIPQFEAVSSRIADYLAERARRTATAQYLARLVSRSDIIGIDIAGADAHRVN